MGLRVGSVNQTGQVCRSTIMCSIRGLGIDNVRIGGQGGEAAHTLFSPGDSPHNNPSPRLIFTPPVIRVKFRIMCDHSKRKEA